MSTPTPGAVRAADSICQYLKIPVNGSAWRQMCLEIDRLAVQARVKELEAERDRWRRAYATSYDDANTLARSKDELVLVLKQLDQYLQRNEHYQHGIMKGDGGPNSLTPAKLVAGVLARCQYPDDRPSW